MLAQSIVLVVGNTSTPAALADLVAFAFDVAEHLGLPVRVAVGMDYRVTDFEAVVLDDSYLDSVPSAVLGVEAREADVCVLTVRELYAFPAENFCQWCGESGRVAPRRARDGWTAPLHFTCASMIRKASAKTHMVAA